MVHCSGNELKIIYRFWYNYITVLYVSEQRQWRLEFSVFITVKKSVYGSALRWVTVCAYIEKFSLNFSNSSFVIRVNLLYASPSLFLYGLSLCLWCFSFLLNCYFSGFLYLPYLKVYPVHLTRWTSFFTAKVHKGKVNKDCQR